MLAATVRVTQDLDLAEECVQDAYTSAVTAWQEHGVPTRPGAWLTTVARRRALDLVRREATLRTKLPLLIEPEGEPRHVPIQDDRLRLLFICCHPALAAEAQVALALRLLCGLSTADVARAFLVSEPTMAARITRAKKKISAARIPYRVPAAEELPARVQGVLATVHLLFTTGHAVVRPDLVERSLDLARLLRSLLPGPEVDGLLALVLFTHARRATRVDAAGRLLLLEEQDRSRWDAVAVAEGVHLVRTALQCGPPGRYALQAAIAAVHADAASWEQTDWSELVALYGLLLRQWPTPVVALNRAVAVGMADGPAAGLAALDQLASEPALATYHYLPAARADLLRRVGQPDDAREAYLEALRLCTTPSERDLLEHRLSGLDVTAP